MEKKYLITGVSGVDPYTNIHLIPQIISEQIDNLGNKKVSINTNNINPQIPREYISDKVFIDGSMLNILRKHIDNKKPITDIYIYLTKEMERNKDIYKTAIKKLYNNKGIENYKIIFYPNDFYPEDHEKKLRSADIHKFASYYKEIYEIYTKIINEKNKAEILLNISSGTPAFKADMMIMAVTNNLKVEQAANYIESQDLENHIKIKENLVYDDLVKKLNEVKKEYGENSEVKIKIMSKQISYFQTDKLNEQLDFLNETENAIQTRSSEEKIDEIKKIVLLESVEDSIAKKDYCGIYYSLKSNEQYLKNNKKELLEIAKNLYYRYIGNDKKANSSIKGNTPELLNEYYPIYKAISIKNSPKRLQDDINFIIEKSNIMKIKSQREEINDWLLISTPLIEAISSFIVIQKTKFDFEKIIDKNYNKETISLSKFNKEATAEIKRKFTEVVKASDNNFLNAYFYKNILFKMEEQESNPEKKEQLNKIIDNIYIVDLARSARVSAAHSIQNISKQEFEELYKRRLSKHSRFKRLKEITDLYINDKANQSIKCVEDSIKKLMIELLPDNSDDTIKYFEESVNIYNTLEKKIIELLKEEIYK